MPLITQQQLKKQISGGGFSPVYLLYGEEDYLTEHYLERTKESAAGELKDFNLQELYTKCGVADIAAAVEQLPVMNDYRCVVVHEFPAEKQLAKDMELLKDLVEKPGEGSVLVFYYKTEPPYKNTKWTNFVKLIEKHGSVLQIGRLDELPLAKMLCDGAAKRGCQMYTTTARRMIETCGNSLRTLLGELNKLCAYAAEKKLITEEDLEQVCTISVEASVFQLSKHIIAGRRKEAFSLLDKLFYLRAEPIAVLSALSMAYLDIYRAKAAVAAGYKAEQAAADFGCKSAAWRFRNAGYSAAGLSFKALRACISVLHQTDEKIKNSRMDSKILLQQAVVKLLYRAGDDLSD